MAGSPPVHQAGRAGHGVSRRELRRFGAVQKGPTRFIVVPRVSVGVDKGKGSAADHT